MLFINKAIDAVTLVNELIANYISHEEVGQYASMFTLSPNASIAIPPNKLDSAWGFIRRFVKLCI